MTRGRGGRRGIASDCRAPAISQQIREAESAAYTKGLKMAFDVSAKVAQREWGQNEGRQMYSQWGGSRMARHILRTIREKQASHE